MINPFGTPLTDQDSRAAELDVEMLGFRKVENEVRKLSENHNFWHHIILHMDRGSEQLSNFTNIKIHWFASLKNNIGESLQMVNFMLYWDFLSLMLFKIPNYAPFHWFLLFNSGSENSNCLSVHYEFNPSSQQTYHFYHIKSASQVWLISKSLRYRFATSTP